ncbi:HesA/MoeB/ThiF family protein [Embleya sp. NPDC001921]
MVERTQSELLFICTSSRRVKRFSAPATIIDIIPLLDGTNSIAHLVRTNCDSDESVELLCSTLRTLDTEGLLSAVDNLDEELERLPPRQARYYDRQLRLFQELCDADLIDCVGAAQAQQRLGNAKVLVCGLGGLGGVVAHALAGAGVGKLVVCDFDRVEVSNLARSFVYSTADVGRAKSEVVAERLRGANPHIQVTAVDRFIATPADLADLVTGCDLVVGCADQPSVAAMAQTVSAACLPDIPHLVAGGYSHHVGVLGALVVPGVTPCRHCLTEVLGREHGRDAASPLVPKRPHGGVIGPQTGIVGNILALEALRHLLGMETVLGHRVVEIDFWPMEFRSRTIDRSPTCPYCSQLPSICADDEA